MAGVVVTRGGVEEGPALVGKVIFLWECLVTNLYYFYLILNSVRLEAPGCCRCWMVWQLLLLLLLLLLLVDGAVVVVRGGSSRRDGVVVAAVQLLLLLPDVPQSRVGMLLLLLLPTQAVVVHQQGM